MNQLLKHIFLFMFPFVWVACSQGVEEEISPETPFPGLEEGEVGFGITSKAGIPDNEGGYKHNRFIHNKSYLRIYNYTGSTLDFTDDANYKWYVYDDSLSVKTGGQYNFRPLGGRGFLWSELSITSGTGYVFDAVVFPHFQKYKNEVSTNQDKSEEFLASDILMAHHVQASSEFRKRVALKFYHVLSMLEVHIYVPKYDPATNTGFPEDALSDVVLPDLYTKFSFIVDAAISSDDPPRVRTHIQDTAPDDCPQGTIRMFSLDDAGLAKIEEGEDNEGRACYIHHFAAILPVQVIKDNVVLLRLGLKTKDGISKEFHYKPNSTASSSISFSAGSITKVKLAVSEEGSKAFLIAAEVKSWEQASTDMSLEKEDEESNP